MSIKPKLIDRKNIRKAYPILFAMAMFLLASCNGQEINNSIRNNLANNVAATMSSATETYDASLETIPKQIRNSTLRIGYFNEEINDYKGSGTGLVTDVITDSAGSSWVIMITAGHVVNRDSQDANLSTQLDEMSFKSLEQKKEILSPDLAVAAFKLSGPQDKSPTVYDINSLSPFNQNLLNPNQDELIALGYPTYSDQDQKSRIQQKFQFASRLLYLGFESPFIKVYGTISGGMSGSPVVDANGNLIGFLSGFETDFSTLITRDPKTLNIQPITEEFLELYRDFVNKIKE